ncbi:putative membrane protein [Okibacterium sp. HSC-33S16]|uniref:general stress protein n=1 Tax=Okibacterium sp. HSC-33S16 TaxID=2910965 RepID=UPI0020A0D038|nr:general stress protein [Okibacterium sp. HSC-33S16]MCP2030415.1 putative membrane protein [Okibacterium sp. HSC-33S16]
MSNPQQRRGANQYPFEAMIPRGETVASFESYKQAQSAVDTLAQADFPVKQISIVGDGLKSVERVTGRLSYGRTAGAGALSGAWLGLFFGLLLIIINPAANFTFVGAAVLIGAAFGMMFSVVSYALNRRRKDFTSVMQVIATSYAVTVAPELANRARNLLDGSAQEQQQP